MFFFSSNNEGGYAFFFEWRHPKPSHDIEEVACPYSILWHYCSSSVVSPSIWRGSKLSHSKSTHWNSNPDLAMTPSFTMFQWMLQGKNGDPNMIRYKSLLTVVSFVHCSHPKPSREFGGGGLSLLRRYVHQASSHSPHEEMQALTTLWGI